MNLLTLLPLLLQDQEGTQQPTGSFTSSLPLLLAIGAIFYFVLIMPERKKQKQRDAMLKAVKKNDEVMTSSGIYGRVAAIQEDVITLLVADGVRMRFNRAAIQSVLGKEDADAEDSKKKVEEAAQA